MLRRLVILGLLLVSCIDSIDGAPCQTDSDCAGYECLSGQCAPDDGVRLTDSILILPSQGYGALYLTPGTEMCLSLTVTNTGRAATSTPLVGRVTSPTPGVTISGGGAVSYPYDVPAGKSVAPLGPVGGLCSGLQISAASTVAPGTMVELDLELTENQHAFKSSVEVPVLQLLVESSINDYCWVGSLKNLGTTTVQITKAVLSSPTKHFVITSRPLDYTGDITPQEEVTLVSADACGPNAQDLGIGPDVSFVEIDLTLTTASGEQIVLPSGFPIH